MHESERDRLAKRQDAATKAHDRMLSTLLQFSPCGKLTVDDIKFIAEMTRTFAFDAMAEVA